MLNPRLDRQPPSRRAMATLGVVLLLGTLSVAVLRARQAGPAPVSGTIYDVTGGVLPGVEVALVDANQNRWAVTTRATGRFELPPVGPGRYVLEVTLAGFRTLRQEFELRDARDWDRAETMVTELDAMTPHALYKLYLGRIRHFRASPPPEWDGVFTFDVK